MKVYKIDGKNAIVHEGELYIQANEVNLKIIKPE